MSAQYHASLRQLSRAIFVSFALIKSTVPSINEVEDRHVEHKHWVVHSPVAPEYCSPFVCEISLPNFHSFFLLLKRFVSFRLSSVVEQENGEKADQNPEHRTENSEPEWAGPS
jgi:hypothetical protein